MHVARLAVDDHRVVAVADAVGDRPLGIELLALLVEIRDLQPRAAPDRARVRLELADQQPQQRRLARPFGPMRPTRSPRMIRCE